MTEQRNPCPWWCDTHGCTAGSFTWGRHISQVRVISTDDRVEASVFITFDATGQPGVAVERDWQHRPALPPHVAEQVCAAVAGFVKELRRGARGQQPDRAGAQRQ